MSATDISTIFLAPSGKDHQAKQDIFCETIHQMIENETYANILFINSFIFVVVVVKNNNLSTVRNSLAIVSHI